MLTPRDHRKKYRAMEQLRLTRMANLQLLVNAHGEGRGAQAAFARAYGCSEAFISNLLSGARNIGEQLARELEERSGKERGWMDSRH